MIDHYVGRGSHFVECQLLGEEGQCTDVQDNWVFRDVNLWYLLIGKV